MPRTDEFLRALRRGGDHEAALMADLERTARRDAESVSAYDARIAPFVRDRHGVPYGTTFGGGGSWCTVRVPRRIAHERSAMLLGATGTGKTTFLAYLATQDLARPDVVLIGGDYQGADSGFAPRLCDHVLPGLAMRLPPERGAALLAGLRVIAPWKNRLVPSLHLTAPGGSAGMRAAQLIDIFGATTGGAGAGEFGPRMTSLAIPVAKLQVQLNVPLPLFRDTLTNPGFRRGLAIAANDPELTAYMDARFTADFRDAGASVLSRLDQLLLDDVTRLALFAPEPFAPASWLEGGTTILDLGGSSGLHRRFFAANLQSGVLGAVMERRPTRRSPHVVVRIDEAHVGIASPAQAAELDDALSRMRGRKAALTIAHQHLGQLASYPSLVQSLKTNAGAFVAFRVPAESAAATSFILPDAMPPGLGADLPEAQVARAWERVLASLPDRVFFLRTPGLSSASIPVRAPDLDVERFGADAPEDIRALAREGQYGFERSELAAREATWHRVVAELGQVAEPNVVALRRFVGLADARPPVPEAAQHQGGEEPVETG